MRKIFVNIFFVLLLSSVSPLFAYAGGLSENDVLTAVENNLFGYDYKNEQNTNRVERIETHLYGSKRTGDLASRLKTIQNDTGINLTPPEPVKTASNPQAGMQNMPERQNTPELKEAPSVEYPIVDEMEKEVFGTSYKKDNIYARLDRLEDKVLHKKTNDNLSDRVDRLAGVIAPRQKQNANRTQYQNQYSDQSYTAEDLDRYYNSTGFEQVNNQSLPFQISAMEREILKSDYSNEPSGLRLNRLEQKLLGRTFSTDSDTTRMQRLMVAHDAKKSNYKYDNNRRAQNTATMTQIGGILLMILAMLL